MKRSCLAGLAAAVAAVSFAFAAEAADYSRDAGFIKRYREAALKIARDKMSSEAARRAEKGQDARPRISTGGAFAGFFLWDTAFACVWAARTAPGEFPAQRSLDNLYAAADKDGFVCREYTAGGSPAWNPRHPNAFAPPLLAWAELELFEHGHSDLKRLEEVYPKLVRHHAACRRYRRSDGLYFGDMLGCGMDDLPRWPVGRRVEDCAKGGLAFTKDMLGPETGAFWEMNFLKRSLPAHSWNRQAGWIDMSAQMAFDARNLAKIAEKLGKSAEAAKYLAEHKEIAAAINRRCWDEKTGFYYDVGPAGLILRRHAGALWTLIAGVVPKDRAARMVKTVADPKVFARPCGLPALAADDHDYDPEEGYWCGSVWPPTTYMAIRGLVECGYRAEAEDLARRWYNATAALWEKTGTCFENISPEQCRGPKTRAARDFCGWAALAPVALPKDFGW